VNVRDKFEVRRLALPIPEILGGTQKLVSPWIRPRFFISKICNGLVFRWTL